MIDLCLHEMPTSHGVNNTVGPLKQSGLETTLL